MKKKSRIYLQQTYIFHFFIFYFVSTPLGRVCHIVSCRSEVRGVRSFFFISYYVHAAHFIHCTIIYKKRVKTLFEKKKNAYNGGYFILAGTCRDFFFRRWIYFDSEFYILYNIYRAL